jgi:hypothetical protein
MVQWLRRRRENFELVEAEADASIDELGFMAYSEARLREREANDLAESRYWNLVALAIARKMGKRMGLDTATRMATSADFARPLETTDLAPLSDDVDNEQVDSQASIPPETPHPANFRLQFLGVYSKGGGPAILAEVEVRAAVLSAAIREASRVAWPPQAIAFRVIEREGREALGLQDSRHWKVRTPALESEAEFSASQRARETTASRGSG